VETCNRHVLILTVIQVPRSGEILANASTRLLNKLLLHVSMTFTHTQFAGVFSEFRGNNRNEKLETAFSSNIDVARSLHSDLDARLSGPATGLEGKRHLGTCLPTHATYRNISRNAG
jgi:hypothetical protein